MPLGSGFAHPKSSGKFLNRVLEIGAEHAQAQGAPVGGPEVAVFARPDLVVRSLG